MKKLISAPMSHTVMVIVTGTVMVNLEAGEIMKVLFSNESRTNSHESIMAVCDHHEFKRKFALHLMRAEMQNMVHAKQHTSNVKSSESKGMKGRFGPSTLLSNQHMYMTTST
jgi:hypothetical protein